MIERLGMDQPGVEKEQEKEKEINRHQSTASQGKDKQPEEQHQTKSHQPELTSKEQVHEKEVIENEEGNMKAARIIEHIVGPDYGNGAINKDLLTEEERKKKKNFEKNWEM
jgi:hypothetical protein